MGRQPNTDEGRWQPGSPRPLVHWTSPMTLGSPDDPDGRCAWATGSPEMGAYHDLEWGVPVRDERALFERLTLEGAQAGLSWSLILAKRDGYRRAFAGFAPDLVARFDDADVARLMTDASIVRNRLKIESTVSNARVIDAMHRAGETLAELLWSFVSDVTVHNALDGARRAPLVDAGVEGHEHRAAPPRVPVRGPRDVLLHHAGGRARERPRGVVPPVGGAGRGGRVGDVSRPSRRASRRPRPPTTADGDATPRRRRAGSARPA